MSYWVALLLTINCNLLLAQEVESDYTSLLTSNVWLEGKEIMAVYKLNHDGTFFCTVQGVKIAGSIVDSMGKWQWLSNDTFTMQTTQRIIDGIPKELHPQPYHKRVIRILRVDNRLLKGITYNILEMEDSEYAREFEWRVKE